MLLGPASPPLSVGGAAREVLRADDGCDQQDAAHRLQLLAAPFFLAEAFLAGLLACVLAAPAGSLLYSICGIRTKPAGHHVRYGMAHSGQWH